MAAHMPRSPWSHRYGGRSVHPDDVLRRLARRPAPMLGPVVRRGHVPLRDSEKRLRILVLVVLAVLSAVVLAPFAVDGPRITVAGVADHAALNDAGLQRTMVAVTIAPASKLRNARVELDGQRVPTVASGDRLLWRPGRIPDGTHRLTVRAGSRFLWKGPSRRTVRFTVDRVAPRLAVPALTATVRVDRPVTITGTVEEGSTVTVAGARATVTGTTFRRRFAVPPIGTFPVVATDPAGNTTTRTRRVPVSIPRLRGVHMTSIAWVTPQLRDPVLAMAKKGLIDTVQLDLKDESGLVGHHTKVSQVNRMKASRNLYDLKTAVDELHSYGVRVVGRLVAFRDPVMATWAWKNGERGAVIQSAAGGPYKGRYGGFTNPANPMVREYNLAIAREAAQAGVDDVLYDYIRRPEGKLSSLVFPGLDGTIEDEIGSFLADTAHEFLGTRTRLGVSVFGIAARNPEQIAQDVPSMARHVDYIAPMVYPSHWGKGWYNVDNPNAQPYAIVKASLADFQAKLRGTGAALVPWLQDFSLGVTYGSAEVRAQIDAAAALGIHDWLLWDPNVTYTAGGLPRPGTSTGTRAAGVSTRPAPSTPSTRARTASTERTPATAATAPTATAATTKAVVRVGPRTPIVAGAAAGDRPGN